MKGLHQILGRPQGFAIEKSQHAVNEKKGWKKFFWKGSWRKLE
jgi:hypothetical protein